MRSSCVEVDTPFFDDVSCFLNVNEPVFVQTFISEFAVEGFADCVLHWLAWADEVEKDIVLCRPREQRSGCELWSVVQDESLRLAVAPDQAVKRASNALSGQAEINFDRQAFASAFVNDVECSVASTGRETVAHKIH